MVAAAYSWVGKYVAGTGPEGQYQTDEKRPDRLCETDQLAGSDCTDEHSYSVDGNRNAEIVQHLGVIGVDGQPHPQSKYQATQYVPPAESRDDTANDQR